MTALAAFPGFGTDCSPDNGSSIWTDWVAPGCTQNDSPGAQFVRDSMFDPFVKDLRQGVGDGVKTMVTFWIDVPDPNVGTEGGAASDVVGFLQSSLAPLVGFLMVLAIMFGAGRIIWDSRHSGEHFKAIVEMIVRYIMVAALAVPVIAIGMIIARELGQFILSQSTQGTQFTDNLFALFSSDAGAVSALALMMLLAIAVLVSALQVIVMIVRGGALLVLTGSILVAASMTNTEFGKDMFRKYVAWIIAFIAYQPAAAIVYAAGFRLLGTDTAAAGNSWLQCIYGITIIGMAVFTLPALLRLVAPFTTPVASGKGMGSAIGGAAITAVTMGAVRGAA